MGSADQPRYTSESSVKSGKVKFECGTLHSSPLSSLQHTHTHTHTHTSPVHTTFKPKKKNAYVRMCVSSLTDDKLPLSCHADGARATALIYIVVSMPGSQTRRRGPRAGGKRVQFGEVTYIPIPPRAPWPMTAVEDPATDLLGHTTDDTVETATESPLVPLLGASSQMPCTPSLTDDLALSPPFSSSPLAALSPALTESHVVQSTEESQRAEDVLVSPEPRAAAATSEPCSVGHVRAREEALASDDEAQGEAETPPARTVVRRLDDGSTTADGASPALSPDADLAPAPPPVFAVRCCFCQLEMEGTDGQLGDACDACDSSPSSATLAPHWTCVDGVTCHTGCALWCAEVYYDTTSARLCHVRDALARAQHEVCDHCRGLGAAVVCAHADCARRYHLPCAVMAQAELFSEDFLLWCPLHRATQPRQ